MLSEGAMRSGRSLPYVFLGPALVVLVILAAVPTLYAVNISLQNRTLSAPDASYVWFDNYLRLFSDARAERLDLCARRHHAPG